MTKRRTEDKARHFTFLIYPESAPEGWVSKLEAIGLPMAISPLHDQDKKENHVRVRARTQREITRETALRNLKNDGETEKYERLLKEHEAEKAEKESLYKKAHYHVVYVAKNAVTPTSVRKRIQRALGNQAVAMVQIVDNIQGMYLYLTHESKDAIEKKKHKYDKADIKHLNNFDIDRYIVLDRADKEDMLKRMRKMIVEQGLCNIIEMDRYVMDNGGEYGINNDGAYQTIIKENAGLLRLYFDGNYQTRNRQQYSENRE